MAVGIWMGTGMCIAIGARTRIGITYGVGLGIIIEYCPKASTLFLSFGKELLRIGLLLFIMLLYHFFYGKLSVKRSNHLSVPCCLVLEQLKGAPSSLTKEQKLPQKNRIIE